MLERNESPSCLLKEFHYLPLPHDTAGAAADLLRQSPYRAVRGVSCEVRQGALVLRGRLPSFYQKQLAQEAVARVPGVSRVLNEIEVSPGSSPAAV